MVETIEAGDAFTGTLAADLARGRALEQALPRAMAAGALAATTAGAYDAWPTAGRVDAWLRERGAVPPQHCQDTNQRP